MFLFLVVLVISINAEFLIDGDELRRIIVTITLGQAVSTSRAISDLIVPTLGDAGEGNGL
ncbi:hypothetical protein PISMIDRAFT_12432 [Pisolithus microcarpus 441]|uniref:Uncharacterized protein n=1 Tax=Pisolithus microcarpus 441 TaxID=765257 RepID=A0A0C9YWJ1_9AGAM|nr:hypothetical protein PISMIDRAFT_12432 [Pisolithus microcarpus 441]